MSSTPFKGRLADTLKWYRDISEGTKFTYAVGISIYNDEVRTVVFSHNKSGYVTGMFNVPNDFFEGFMKVKDEYFKELDRVQKSIEHKKEEKKEEKPAVDISKLGLTPEELQTLLQLMQSIQASQQVKRD
ncbi:MAG: hypothetical protein QW734_08520 [Candidatus Bathyarchaeia archaeon]